MSSSYINLATYTNMQGIGFTVAAVLTVYVVSRLLYRWRNPKCNGVLPPGSMGLPFIGETLQLIMPSASLDLPPFIKSRIKRYGPVFRTNVAGRPVVVTADREFNYYILKQDGKLVDTWSLDTFAEVFDQASQSSRKYTRNLTLNHFGVEALKDKLIPRMEDMVSKTLADWSSRESVEVKSASITMSIDFAASQLFSGDLENAPLKLSDMFNDLVEGLMSFPLNIPGTAHHKCLKIHKEVRKTMGDVLRKRQMSSDKTPRDDLLDHLIQDMNKETFLNEDFIVQLMFGLLFVTSDSISTTMALAFKLLAEHPLVLEELTNEHEAILEKREHLESPLTWDEYKSMTFTRQVINEVLRLGNIAPGLFRRALKDIPVNGYTIPAGWVIMIATSALHLNHDEFNNALEFNPGRWKDIQASVVAKSFMPFGVGMKQCAGAEYSRVLLATFLHVLVTKYKWAMVKGGKIVRAPIIRFPEGFHFKISEKAN
ncbi:beta-amyrin 16-alpha-hydroxylase CYP87D16 [Daucus carota subsp. sativus]